MVLEVVCQANPLNQQANWGAAINLDKNPIACFIDDLETDNKYYYYGG